MRVRRSARQGRRDESEKGGEEGVEKANAGEKRVGRKRGLV